jgi:hypothetical protein
VELTRLSQMLRTICDVSWAPLCSGSEWVRTCSLFFFVSFVGGVRWFERSWLVVQGRCVVKVKVVFVVSQPLQGAADDA